MRRRICSDKEDEGEELEVDGESGARFVSWIEIFWFCAWGSCFSEAAVLLIFRLEHCERLKLYGGAERGWDERRGLESRTLEFLVHQGSKKSQTSGRQLELGREIHLRVLSGPQRAGLIASSRGSGLRVSSRNQTVK